MQYLCGALKCEEDTERALVIAAPVPSLNDFWRL